jgi:Tol biopolymer transport system component
MTLEGKNLTQLTTMQEGACQPDWSPDGRRLLFISPCKIQSDDFSKTTIFELDIATMALNTLTRVPGGDYDPAFSPDGKKIAFTSKQNGPMGIYIMDSDGQNRIRLSKSGAKEAQPRWSPDGQKLVFTRYLDRSIIFSIDVATSPDTNVAVEISHENHAVNHPDWSSDGLSILFLYGGGNGQLWITTEANTFKTINRTEPYSRSTLARFSPDGMWILYDMRVGENVDLYLLPVFGSDNPRRITDDSGIDTDPAWQPVPAV